MAQIDELNQALATQTQSVQALSQSAADNATASQNLINRIAALPPAGGPDLAPAIAAVQANTAEIDSARGVINATTIQLNSALS